MRTLQEHCCFIMANRLPERCNGDGGAATPATGSGPAAQPSPPAAAQQQHSGQDAVEGAADPAGAAEKLLRGIQKKLRQCEALQERRARGEPLTGPELEKLGRVPGWCAPAHWSCVSYNSWYHLFLGKTPQTKARGHASNAPAMPTSFSLRQPTVRHFPYLRLHFFDIKCWGRGVSDRRMGFFTQGV